MDKLTRQAKTLLNDFMIAGNKNFTFKSAMERNGITYNPKKCHYLKIWAEYAFNYADDETESINDFLKIVKGGTI